MRGVIINNYYITTQKLKKPFDEISFKINVIYVQIAKFQSKISKFYCEKDKSIHKDQLKFFSYTNSKFIPKWEPFILARLICRKFAKSLKNHELRCTPKLSPIKKCTPKNGSAE